MNRPNAETVYLREECAECHAQLCIVNGEVQCRCNRANATQPTPRIQGADEHATLLDESLKAGVFARGRATLPPDLPCIVPMTMKQIDAQILEKPATQPTVLPGDERCAVLMGEHKQPTFGDDGQFTGIYFNVNKAAAILARHRQAHVDAALAENGRLREALVNIADKDWGWKGGVSEERHRGGFGLIAAKALGAPENLQNGWPDPTQSETEIALAAAQEKAVTG